MHQPQQPTPNGVAETVSCVPVPVGTAVHDLAADPRAGFGHALAGRDPCA
jgi:hypothetical protein